MAVAAVKPPMHSSLEDMQSIEKATPPFAHYAPLLERVTGRHRHGAAEG